MTVCLKPNDRIGSPEDALASRNTVSDSILEYFKNIVLDGVLVGAFWTVSYSRHKKPGGCKPSGRT